MPSRGKIFSCETTLVQPNLYYTPHYEPHWFNPILFSLFSLLHFQKITFINVFLHIYNCSLFIKCWFPSEVFFSNVFFFAVMYRERFILKGTREIKGVLQFLTMFTNSTQRILELVSFKTIFSKRVFFAQTPLQKTKLKNSLSGETNNMRLSF